MSPAGEEDSGGHIHKRKRKRKKRSHFQPDTQDLDAVATPAVPSAASEPDAAQRQAPQACVTEPTAEAVSSIGENSCEPTPVMPIHNKRKRPKRKNLRAHREMWKSTTLPQGDMSKNDAVGRHPQSSAAHIFSGVQARKKKRKLGALPVSSGDLTVQEAGTPTSSVEGNDGQTTQPWCKTSQKKTASSTLDPCDLSNQKTADSKKKKMKQTSNGVLGSSAGQIQALVRREGAELWASVAVLRGLVSTRDRAEGEARLRETVLRVHCFIATLTNKQMTGSGVGAQCSRSVQCRTSSPPDVPLDRKDRHGAKTLSSQAPSVALLVHCPSAPVARGSYSIELKDFLSPWTFRAVKDLSSCLVTCLGSVLPLLGCTCSKHHSMCSLLWPTKPPR